jgi:uncharacterized cupredoxin-like copper-binding protein
MIARNRVWRSSVVVVSLASAGWHCVLGGHHHGPTKDVRVEATEFRFAPRQLTLRPGMYRFVLVNRGQVLHNLKIQDPAERAGRSDATGGDQHAHLAKAEAAPGRSATATVMLKPGTYRFMCHVRGHRAAGMTGRLVVKES